MDYLIELKAEIEGAISNERLWEKAVVSGYNFHTENIIKLTEQLEHIDNILYYLECGQSLIKAKDSLDVIIMNQELAGEDTTILNKLKGELI